MTKCKDCFYLKEPLQSSTKWFKCKQGNVITKNTRSCYKFVNKNKVKNLDIRKRDAKKLKR